MAKKNGKTEGNGKTNGELVFEKMDDDYTIPARSRLGGSYDEVLGKLKDADGALGVIFRSPEDAPKPANTKRKSLIMAGETKGMWIHAAVRLLTNEKTGAKENVLLAQYKGKLSERPAKAEKEE